MSAAMATTPITRKGPHGRCEGADLAAFFPRDYEPTAVLVARMRPVAERYCAPCPLRVACREAGRQAGHGLWGGVLYRINASLAKNDRTAIDLLAESGRGG